MKWRADSFNSPIQANVFESAQTSRRPWVPAQSDHDIQRSLVSATGKGHSIDANGGFVLLLLPAMHHPAQHVTHGPIPQQLQAQPKEVLAAGADG